MSIITITDGAYTRKEFCITGFVGDLLTVSVQVNDTNNNAEDLSSGTIGVTIKGDANDSDANAFYRSSVSGPSNGAYTWLIPGSGASPKTNIWWTGNTTFPAGEFIVEICKWDGNNNRTHLQTGKLTIFTSVIDYDFQS